jgi:hypothetical protein
MRVKRIRPFVVLVLLPFVGMTILARASEPRVDQGAPSIGTASPAQGTRVDGERTLEQIFSAYLYEKTLCPRLAEIVSQHATLPKELDAEFWKPSSSDKTLLNVLHVLLDGALRDEPEIQYVRSHLDYFELLIFYHPISGATLITPSFPLLCLLTEKRILELEAFGPSAQAWEARRDLLNDIRDDLSMPWHEGPTHLPFSTLSIMFDRAKTIFIRPEDVANLAQWVSETEAIFHQLTESLDPAGYNANWSKEEQLEWKAEQRETLRTWIATLLRGL